MCNYVLLEAEADGDVEFELETCGGAAVWVNGTFVADFTPFTRNMVKRTTIVLPLKAGRNRLLVCLDDLAAVSYTHLDVYKRQPPKSLVMTIRQPAIRIRPRPAEMMSASAARSTEVK